MLALETDRWNCPMYRCKFPYGFFICCWWWWCWWCFCCHRCRFSLSISILTFLCLLSLMPMSATNERTNQAPSDLQLASSFFHLVVLIWNDTMNRWYNVSLAVSRGANFQHSVEWIQFRHESWLCCCNSDCTFLLQWKCRSHFVRWRVCINFAWNSGFQRFFSIAFACLPVSFTFWLWMGGILYFIITSNVICVVIVIRLSFIALECFPLFYLLCFVSFSIEQNKVRSERVCSLTGEKEAHISLAVCTTEHSIKLS